MAKNNLGEWAEHEAVKILRQSGYTIVKLNYFSRFGEIDIIAEAQQELVFIEVKARTSSYRGYAFEAVNLIKQQKMIKTAFRFLQEYPQ